MKNSLKFTFCLASLFFLISCTSTKSIQKNISSQSYTLAYVNDSKLSKSKNPIAVDVESILMLPDCINDSTIVKREKGWFLPLLVINIWNYQNTCNAGKSIIQEDIPTFLQSSLINEIKRSGNFYVDSQNKSDYKVELTIDEIKNIGPYVSKGFFYFAVYVYGFSYGDYAGPAVSSMKGTYKLKKGNQILLSKSFSSEHATEQIKKGYVKPKELQKDYAISMVEATSNNIKKTIELIVNDLNAYFNDKETTSMASTCQQ